MDFNDPKSEVIVSYSYFFNNTADMGTCFYANNPTGTLYIERNVFIENKAITEFRVLIGSGSILTTGGFENILIKFYHNLNFFNQVEYKGGFFFVFLTLFFLDRNDSSVVWKTFGFQLDLYWF